MVLEQLFKARWVEKRPSTSFVLGIIFTVISFISALLIFRNTPHLIGITTIFFTVILAIPGVNKLFADEEQIEADEKKSFLKEHEAIIDFSLYFFLGIFVVFLIISLFKPELILSKNDFLGVQETARVNIEGLPLPPMENISLSIIKNNLFVMLVLFLLSFFYSSGALFIIVLNASIFAHAFTDTIRSGLPSTMVDAFTYTLCGLGTRFLHTIPEVMSYFLVAIAGGVLSKAVTKEKIFSKRFYKVLKDSIILLVIAIVVLIIAALIEENITLNLLMQNICTNKVVLVITLLLMAGFLTFELWRQEKI